MPVAFPLAQSFSIAEPYLRQGDRSIWGRDFICLALWTPNDPTLIKAAEAAGVDLADLSKGWLRFLLDSDRHRPTQEWQQWFDEVNPSPQPSLDHFSAKTADILASAEMSRLSRGASKIHNEDLLIGLYARPDAPLRLLFRRRELDDNDLIAAVMPDNSGVGAPLNLSHLIADPLTGWPALSRHAAKAVEIAASSAHSSESTVIDAPHLLLGALSVPECSPVAALARMDIRADGLPQREREHVRFLADETVGLSNDELGRRAVAEVLRDQLGRLVVDYPHRSFLVHVDGAWGAGKSTLLRFLHESIRHAHEEARTRQDPTKQAQQDFDWLVVTYDAWRQARVGPPWLTVLQTLRKKVQSERGLRFWFMERARLVSGWRWIAAGVMLVLAAALIGLVVLAGSTLSLGSYGDLLKLLPGLLTFVGALWLIAKSFGQFVTLDSRRSASTFVETRTDPMEELSDHFHWVLQQARRPVLLLIDDLDRCPEAFVVQLLDSIQKLMRDPDPIHGGTLRLPDKNVKGPSAKPTPPLLVVVAADGRWLRSSYDNTYASSASAVKEPGATIGSLFLEKIFQLSVPVPTLSDELRSDYLASVLSNPGRRRQPAAASSEESDQLQLVEKLEKAAPEDRLDVLAAVPRRQRVKVASAAVRQIVIEDKARAETRHALQQYGELLDPTPRAMKRFVMEYFVLRAVRTAEGSVVPRGPLALWTIVVTRWPLLAEFLRNSPASVHLFGSSREQIASSVPAELIDLFHDPPQELRNVMNHAHGPLDTKRIRDASGQAMVVA